MSTNVRCRWGSKRMSEENWENVSILKRLQKRSAFSVCLKYLLKLRPGFVLTTSTIFDSPVKKIALHCPINASRPHRDNQAKKTKSLPVRRKDHLHILWIFLLLWHISIWCWSYVKDLSYATDKRRERLWNALEFNCCGATEGSEQQHNQDLKEIYKGQRILEFITFYHNALHLTRVHCATNNSNKNTGK